MNQIERDALVDNLHTDQQASESWKLVCQIAGFLKDGEFDDDGHEFDMPNDDAVETLHRVISEARRIYWLEG